MVVTNKMFVCVATVYRNVLGLNNVVILNIDSRNLSISPTQPLLQTKFSSNYIVKYQRKIYIFFFLSI